MNRLRTISKKTVFTHPWEKVFIEKVKTPKGVIFDYLLTKPNDFVVIVAFLDTHTILTMTQYKHGAQKELLGFPAGYIQKKESPIKAAARELYEETGYRAKQMRIVATLSENPTIRRNQFHVVFATGIKKDPMYRNNPDTSEGDLHIEKTTVRELTSHRILKRMRAAPMLAAIPFILSQVK